MNTDLAPIVRDRHQGLSVTFLVGENGAGKSRLLRDLAGYYRDLGCSVVAVCNTIYDRFHSVRGLTRVTASRGRRLPTEVLKQAITDALEDGPTKLRTISKTLDYCGYRSDFGLLVHGFSAENLDRLRLNARSLRLTQQDIEEIESTCALAASRVGGEPWWMDFTEFSFSTFLNEGLARLVKWEAVLRKMRVLRRIDIYLKRRDGLDISVNEASSGELTLISTLVFLAVNLKEDSVLLIDEPENSLHPQWQKEYVSRLANLLYYQQPMILVATHAPIVVSGARAAGDLRMRIFRTANGIPELVRDPSQSVEGTLWQVFRTVTPLNHFVSEHLVNAIADIQTGAQPPDDVFTLIAEMKNASYDPAQEPFFDAVRQLAQRVQEEPRRD